MAQKIYKTLNGITSYSSGLVMPNGTKRYVYFTGGSVHPKFIPSTFSTDDPELQKALEKSASYGKKFKLAAELKEEAKPASDDDEVKLTPYQNTSIASAITTLIKQGWDGDTESLTDVDSVQEAAKSLGITFPKLK